MATQYIKYAKKCRKNFFSKIIGGAMAPFGQGVATPMERVSKVSGVISVFLNRTLVYFFCWLCAYN